MKEEFHLIDQLEMDQFLSRDEWIFLIEHRSDALERYLLKSLKQSVSANMAMIFISAD